MGGCKATVCESKEWFDQVRRTLRNDDLYAHGLNYSQDPWQFEYNDRYRGRGAELGDFPRQDEDVQNTGDSDIEGLPWDNPFFPTYTFGCRRTIKTSLMAFATMVVPS